MGGILLGAPKAPSLPTPLVQQTPVSVSDDAQARIDGIERQRRGRAGTVQTSDRGLVQLNASVTHKKSLLGE